MEVGSDERNGISKNRRKGGSKGEREKRGSEEKRTERGALIWEIGRKFVSLEE